MIAFFAAAESGDVKKIAQLLDQSQKEKSDLINDTDYRSRSALHLAVEHGHHAVAQLLIDRGIELDATDCGGFTALHLAAELGHDKIVAQLLKKSPSTAERGAHSELTCLHLAVIRGHTKVVKQLLALDIDLNAQDKYEMAALNFAVDFGREEIVKMLIESVKSKPPLAKVMLHTAMTSGYETIAIKLLAQNPRLVDVADLEGRSALHLAAVSGCHKVAAQLFAERPHLAEVGGTYEMSLLHFAAEFGFDAVVAELLVEKPHLVDITGEDDKSVLHLAAENGHDKVVAQLLAAKPALATTVDESGQTALHWAARNGHDVVVGQLLELYPRLVDAEDVNDRTPLRLAVRDKKGDGKAVARLLACGPSLVDEDMLWTALGVAKDGGNEKAARLLLEHNPRLAQSLDDPGNTVLHIAFGLRGPFSEARFTMGFMGSVWRMFPEALHKTNHRHYTPFHVALETDNKFAIGLVQGKLSLDELLAAHEDVNERFPQELVEDVRELLEEPLNKDVAGTVSEYLGLANKNKNKRARTEDSDNDSDSDSEPFDDEEDEGDL